MKFKKTYDYTRKAGRSLYEDVKCERLGSWIYKALDERMELEVRVARHDIPYKEQLWGIPERAIQYNIELIKEPFRAVQAAKETHKSNENGFYEELAKYGVMRYYRIYTTENVKSALTDIGFVSVYAEEDLDGKEKPKYRVFLHEMEIMNEGVNPSTVKKNIKKLMDNMMYT